MPNAKKSAGPKGEFPFAFFDHGAIDLDSKLKNAETFVLFQRDVKPAERKKIQGSCPEAISGMFIWGDRFAYLGSGGDTFEFDVVNEFAGDKAKKLIETDDWGGVTELIPEAMVTFAAAYDTWLRSVHALVPIACADAPASCEPDEWAEWSEAHVDPALAALEAASKADRAKESFGWIRARILGKLGDSAPNPAQRTTRLKAVVDQYARLEIGLPLSRLTITESHIHSLGDALSKALTGMDAEARAGALCGLEPLAQLAYLASYTALDNGDLEAHSDLANDLDALVEAVPDADRWRAAALMAFAAENLAHITPGFDKPDAKKAGTALPIFKKAIARGARDSETFYAALTCAQVAKNSAVLQSIATEGIDATRNLELAKEASKAASKLGDASAAKRFTERAKALKASSDLAQKLKGSIKLAEHLAQGGEPTTDVLGHLALGYANSGSSKAEVKRFLEAMSQVLLAEPTFGLNVDVVLNFCVCAGNNDFSALAVDTVCDLLDRGLHFRNDLPMSLTYAATHVKDNARKERVIAQVEAGGNWNAPALVCENMASVYLQAGDEAKAIGALKQAKKLKHPNFAKLRTDPDLKPLFNKKVFRDLFK